MKILITSLEVTPFAKVGGLADIAGSLPKALNKLGYDVRVSMPKHKTVDETKFPMNSLIKEMSVPIGDKEVVYSVEETMIPNTEIPVYLIGNEEYYNRDGIYQTPEGIDFPDNDERFICFSKAVLEMLNLLEWQPDVIHCNDWHTAFIPVYLKSLYSEKTKLKQIATLYTVHNLAFQGLFPIERSFLTGLEEDLDAMEALTIWDQLNLMKGGLLCADILNAVSKRYSQEIQTVEYGCGLESILQTRQYDLYGVLNGIDYDIWFPSTDADIVPNYDYETIGGKKVCKEALQKTLGLSVRKDTPLIGMVSRLDAGKGFDILAEGIHDIMKLDVQFVLLGTGHPQYHKIFEKIGSGYRRRMSINLKFDAKLSRQIYAGADIFLMPSRYEPCGLGQMISLAYGTIPIVRSVGGLADTISNFNPESGEGNGFVFEEYSSEQLVYMVKKAVGTFGNKDAWVKLIKNAMDSDFSWSVSAQKYVELYEKAVAKRALKTENGKRKTENGTIGRGF